ncbi:ATPase [Photobacterium gaetbulicola]|uniref:ATPase n=1 Tax=Photobacterium gaetbulicola TaxID=1295392 RepID=A0A0B9GGK2_9GAMM|nr:ATP-binding protein [Photobacterium gaetbulicola]KHT63905.1 ATPase [Photobacterium gaetbulicola]
MVEALRGLGYSTATALADIIDNSISAGADTINIQFDWYEGSSTISILDNGSGMDASELLSAMRLGDKNPLHERDGDDLGRFGLGLKTASFSQCRRLTVATKKTGEEENQCLRWDLDVLSDSTEDGWYLLRGTHSGSEKHIEPLDSLQRGTIVVWERLDRIVTPGFDEQAFFDLIDSVEQHLSMVFHRYLEGRNPKLTLKINKKALQPWDPFMMGHPAKPWATSTIPMPSEPKVELECHVLPHKDKLSKQEYEKAAGPSGWTQQQGFYVYRNERLLVPGSWLGLRLGNSSNKDEAHQLARIKLDISNDADELWKIDIRKSRAQLPPGLRKFLARYAKETRERARKTFAFRGKVTNRQGSVEIQRIWDRKESPKGTKYSLDRKHPAIQNLIRNAEHLSEDVNVLLRLIEGTVPVQRIWLDTAENKEAPQSGFDSLPSNGMSEMISVILKNMVNNQKITLQQAKESLMTTEPFQDYPELIRHVSLENKNEK